MDQPPETHRSYGVVPDMVGVWVPAMGGFSGEEWESVQSFTSSREAETGQGEAHLSLKNQATHYNIIETILNRMRYVWSFQMFFYIVW